MKVVSRCVAARLLGLFTEEPLHTQRDRGGGGWEERRGDNSGSLSLLSSTEKKHLKRGLIY